MSVRINVFTKSDVILFIFYFLTPLSAYKYMDVVNLILWNLKVRDKRESFLYLMLLLAQTQTRFAIINIKKKQKYWTKKDLVAFREWIHIH